jgi:sulfite reductase (ferredoxin)
MLQAARALTKQRNPNLGEDADEIVREFRAHYYDTKLFFDPYAGGKFAQYFFRAYEDKTKNGDTQAAHQLIEEAQLFVDAAHQCYTRIGTAMP